MVKTSSVESAASTSAVEDFFTGDDGRSIFGRNNETRTIASVDTVASILQGHVLAMPLQVLCDYIKDHKSVWNARIVSSSCYAERVHLFITHRFLILHLQRDGKKDIHLRLDRIRSQDLDFLGFALAGGKTRANDIGRVSFEKSHLVLKARWENTQAYGLPPLLGDFRQFLLAIVGELLSYEAWPNNCWLFCSLLQQHLGEIGQGAYIKGTPQHLTLSPDVRSRVRLRAMSDYPAVLYVRAQVDHQVTNESDIPYSANDIIAVIGTRTDNKWLGIHINELKRQPGRFLLDPKNMLVIPSPDKFADSRDTIEHSSRVLFYARAITNSVQIHPWDVIYQLGDVIAVVHAPEDQDWWAGYILDRKQNGSKVRWKIREQSTRQNPNFLVRRADLVQIPTSHRRPDLEFLDKFTPILYFARVLDVALEASPMVAENHQCSIGDVIPIIAAEEPYVIGMQSALNFRRCFRFQQSTVFRIPTRLERPELTFLNDRTPILYCVRALWDSLPPQDKHDLAYKVGDVIGIIAERDSTPYLGVLMHSSHRVWDRCRIRADQTVRIPSRDEALDPKLDYLDDHTPVLFYVCATKDYSSDHEQELEFKQGDAIAVISERTSTPLNSTRMKWLGVLLNESSRVPGRFLLDPAMVRIISKEDARSRRKNSNGSQKYRMSGSVFS